jgi:hypothetical protein
MQKDKSLSLLALAGVAALAGDIGALIDPPRHDRYHRARGVKLTKPKLRRGARVARRKMAKRSKKRNRR